MWFKLFLIKRLLANSYLLTDMKKVRSKLWFFITVTVLVISFSLFVPVILQDDLPVSFTPNDPVDLSTIVVPSPLPLFEQPKPYLPSGVSSLETTLTVPPQSSNTQSAVPTNLPPPAFVPVARVTPAQDASGEILFFEQIDEERARLLKIVTGPDGNPLGEPQPIQVKGLAFRDISGNVFFSLDGKKIILNSLDSWGYKRFVDLEAGTLETYYESDFHGWYPDSQWILTSQSGYTLKLGDFVQKQFVDIADPAGVIAAAAASPDGQQIIYADSSLGGVSTGLWMVQIGGEPRFLFSIIAAPRLYLTWSPDGKKVSYWSEGKVWVMDTDGKNLHSFGDFLLIGNPWYQWMGPRWSPDSRTLMVNYFGKQTENEDQGTAYDSSNIELIDVETGQRRMLLPSGSSGHLEPCWSPDGKQIAFLSILSGQPELWLINADGSNLRQVTNGGNPLRAPYWHRP